MRQLAAALLLALSATMPTLATAQVRDTTLDDFENASAWTLVASDDVQAALRPADGEQGNALCVDFDFGRVTGYVAARRTLPIEFPARYELALRLRGDAPPNALQVKLVDASGANVWWARRNEVRFPSQWQTLRFRQREIEFAWGPTADRALRRTVAVELVIASGSGAGKGSVCFDRLELRELPASEPMPAPKATAVSSLPGHEPANAIDGRPGTDWQPTDGRGAAAVLTVDYGAPREFGVLALRWRPGAAASRYAIELSDDGEHWRGGRRVERARGDVQLHWLPDSEARFVRISVDEPAAKAVALAELELRAPVDANTFFAQLAKQAPRGRYPRAYVGQQSYWTVLGVDGGHTASLLSEDGVLEPIPGVGALEPFLVVDGKVLSWADARIGHTLRDGDLPMPSVHWRVGDLTLDIEAFGDGTADAAQALARYRVRNLGKHAHQVTLALAWRPFQANPPTQFLANPGGASAIGELAWDGRVLAVNGTPRLQPLVTPSAVRLEPLAAGPVGDWLREHLPLPGPMRIDDPAGFASAALSFDLRLRPGEDRGVAVALPVSGTAVAATMTAVAAAEERAAAHWRARLDRVRITGPTEVEDIARTMRTALGQILVDRSAAALQPGPRAYARSWIRDGALTSSALLRLGQDDVARNFLLWFAPFQFTSGKVPCCATARGADPVPENDSDGEFAFAAADLWRYTRDDATARALWPRVRRAVEHMDELRTSERTQANLAPDRRAYFGLMPPSISHEGYSDKPAYSYWDDFWTAIGYRGAVELAQGLGLSDDATRIAGQRDEFLSDLLASIAASTKLHALDVLPGAADRGDVDPTSSTIALSPGGLLGTLPDALVRNTFERYWRDFSERRSGATTWDAYTPYEWRTVGSLVRLGERERALQAMAFFYRDRRPLGWNQWAELVVRNAREPRFLGDMPHGWVASDQIRSVLDLFAYEDESKHSMTIAAGVPMSWFDGPGLAVQDLRTPYGRLSWSGRAITVDRRRVVAIDVGALRAQPPGGVVLRGPWPKTSRVWIDGTQSGGAVDAIHLSQTPSQIRIELPSTR
ncbi:MAG TPA: discoidin domain-containing protein [Caldimonas sp.]|nr:discoidin domain-containing protein [Caldimonas sp.]HEX4233608.1 discoidin domain-containing protein [Caldimonas sp.]